MQIQAMPSVMNENKRQCCMQTSQNGLNFQYDKKKIKHNYFVNKQQISTLTSKQTASNWQLLKYRED